MHSNDLPARVDQDTENLPLLVREQSVVVPMTPSPFTPDTMVRLEELCSSLKFIRSITQDGEHALLRNRGILKSLDANVREICDLLKKTELLDMFEHYYRERLYVEGAQVNRMCRGDVLRQHGHGNDARFAVLHFSGGYTGGRYFDYDVSGFKRYPHIAPYSMVLNAGNIQHGVEQVTSETSRVTLVMFLSKAPRVIW